MKAYKPSDADLKDMQSLIGSGFGSMEFSEYLLLEVTCAPKARAWLTDAMGFVSTVADLRKRADGQDSAAPGETQHEAWSIAFTYRGLTRLAIVEDADAPFPSEFRAGQADESRRTLLREDPSITWLWSDVPAPAHAEPPVPVSMLVARLHDQEAPAANPLLATQALAASGLVVVRRVHGSPDSFETVAGKSYIREPFGFRDGISQPEIQGLYSREGAYPAGTPAEGKRVPLGEFVLGHPNAYGEASHCPKVQATGTSQAHPFGRNGCYLAVQQILQHVDAFRDFDQRHPGSGNGPSVVEKIVGRRREGQPLQFAPRPAASDNAFGFRTNDPQGLQCPIGAHIRRANPRDSLADSGELGSPSSNLHRLLRRGRPFRSHGAADGPLPSPKSVPSGAMEEVGLFFIAIVADLARQFEFVKRVWIGNPGFGDLCEEADPLLGRASSRRFTMPGLPTGVQLKSLPEFTTTQGGGYFFMPGKVTLAAIARGDFTAVNAAPGATAPSAGGEAS